MFESILKDRVIIVAGGSGLIGKSILNLAIKEKSQVVNLDIIPSGIKSVDDYIIDITKERDFFKVFDEIIDKYNRVDGFINCSYPRTDKWGKSDFNSLSMDEWKANVDLHLNSYFHLSRRVLFKMKDQRNGAIVNFASIYGEVGNDFSLYEGLDMFPPPMYAAIKGGIINLTRYLASLFGKDGIRINCISPGGIFDNQNAEFVKRYEDRVPLKRMGTPEDIAPVACFLVSDGARYITGQNILVDGGWTCI